MKKLLLVYFTTVTTCLQLVAQNVGIGTTTPDASAILDVTATDKGVLVPRVNSLSIANPAKGLLVYYNLENSFYYYNGAEWKICSLRLGIT